MTEKKKLGFFFYFFATTTLQVQKEQYRKMNNMGKGKEAERENFKGYCL